MELPLMTCTRALTLTLLAAIALTGPVQAAPGARVVSRTGGGGEGPPATVVTGEVRLEAGETLQLLLAGGGRTAGICGPARLRVLAGADIELLFGEGPLLLTGNGGRLILWRRGSVILDPAGSAVLLHGDRLYVVRGRARVALRAGQPPASAPARPLARTLKAGQWVRLDAGAGLAMADGRPPAELLARGRSHGPPPAWDPEGLDEVSVEDVERARQRTAEERQAAREAASCGCTEGSGSGTDHTSGGDRTTTLEQFKARLQVKVSGLPARGQ
jgi:hypothetical protein